MLVWWMHEVNLKAIDISQSGFVPGRQILYNVLLTSQLIKGYRRHCISPSCMIKIDLRNVYYSIKWSFIRDMMVELSFQSMYVQWIMNYITTVSYSAVINGKPTCPFKDRKGLQQGDSLSSFLFALVMEYLSRCMNTLHSNPTFHYHPRCKKFRLTNLLFADDLLLFYLYGWFQSIQVIFSNLSAFLNVMVWLLTKINENCIVLELLRRIRQKSTVDWR